jgi:ethanolamine utilization protein EutQ (cupin superfamily)
VPLFVVTPEGRLSIASDGRPATARPGDTVIALVQAGDGGRPSA